MNYEMEVHIPNQMEALLTQRNNVDINGFDYILMGIKNLMNKHKDFINGLKTDEEKRKKRNKELYQDAKNKIIKALQTKNNEEGLNVTAEILSQLEQVYNQNELLYMNDVIQTCVSYQSNDNNGKDS